MPETTVVKCARIIDGTGTVIPGANLVVIRDGAIVAVGDQTSAGYPDCALDATVVDLASSTLMPGLINCHDHFATRRSRAPAAAIFARSQAYQALLGARNCLLSLASGVLVLRDMGAPGLLARELALAVEQGLVLGPGIVSCINGITRPSGPGAALSMTVSSTDEVRAAVDYLAEAGANFIKVFAATDGSAPDQPTLTAEEIRAAVRRAQDHGLKTAAHTITRESISVCLQAGITCIEHAPELDRDLAREMALSDVVFVPTMSGFHMIGTEGWLWGRTREKAQIFASFLQPHMTAVRSALEEGVKVAAGTDGLGTMAMEVQLLERAGMRTSDALQAAMGSGAQLLGLNHCGKVAPGFDAELIAVDGDPLSDPTCIDHPVTIFHSGKVFDARALRELCGTFDESPVVL